MSKVLTLLTVLLAGPAAARSIDDGRQDLSDLPLVVKPVGGPSDLLALVMSGDGNWASFVSAFADGLVERSIPVVGLESRTYLRHPRTPDEVVADMERVWRHYVKAWQVERILVIGYSRGADFAPFVVNELSPDLRVRIVGVGLFSPTKMASFEFHLTDLIKYRPRPTDVPLVPQIEALESLPVLCVYGVRDRSSLCPLLDSRRAKVVPLDHGHRLGDPSGQVVLLLDALGLAATSRARDGARGVGGRTGSVGYVPGAPRVPWVPRQRGVRRSSGGRRAPHDLGRNPLMRAPSAPTETEEDSGTSTQCSLSSSSGSDTSTTAPSGSTS